MKKYTAVLVLICLFSILFTDIVWALPANKDFSLPANAVKISDNIFDLGEAKDPTSGKLVRGYAILNPKEDKFFGFATAGRGKGKSGSSQCYSFMSSGAKWKNKESWILNPINSEGLTDLFLFANMENNIAKWENGADGVMDNAVVDIFSTGDVTNNPLSADSVSPDGQNEVYFGSISESGVIAVTTVWGVFGGAPQNRQLVEWDMVFDETDFDWSSSGEAGKMDFENIATHELGHALGMGHPEDSCLDETMYRFAGLGETKKRDLGTGDVKGIDSLY